MRYREFICWSDEELKDLVEDVQRELKYREGRKTRKLFQR